MARISYRLVTLLTGGIFLAGVVAPFAYGAEELSKTSAATEKTPSSKRKVVVEEDVLSPLVGAPKNDFKEAREQLKVGNVKAAAADIKAAAALIRIEAARPDAEGKHDLLSSADDLDKLASSVEKGEVKSPSELNNSFARADLALASHYHLMAKDEMLRGNKKQALVWLTAATEYIDDSVSWSNRELKEGGTPLVKKMHELSEKISQGAKSATEATERGFDALGQDIKNLASKLSQ